MPALKGKQMGGNHVVGAICVGYGTSGEDHRPDCTVKPGKLRCCRDGCTATRRPGVKFPIWGYAPSTGYLCPEHM